MAFTSYFWNNLIYFFIVEVECMNKMGLLIDAMIRYYEGDVKRINHFIKVYGFSKAIGEMENLDQYTQNILEVAAITHDIGIKNSELKYNSSAGNYQQIEGPPVAKIMLEDLGFDSELIERVCWLIAHHHTYSNIAQIDHQILVEADFIVNAFEDDMSVDSIRSVCNKIFKTQYGKKFMNSLIYR